MYLIYELRFPNNKLYVGITNSFYRRMAQHKNVAKLGKSNLPLYKAICKYGWDNIIKKILHDGLEKEEAVTREIEIILKLNLTKDGYNLSPGGCVPGDRQAEGMIKRHQNKEYKERMVTLLRSNELQRKESLRTPEHRKLVSDRNIEFIKEGINWLPIIRKPIICNETKEIFPSVTDAAKHFRGQRTHLRSHLKRDKYRPRFKGFTFNYVGN